MQGDRRYPLNWEVFVDDVYLDGVKFARSALVDMGNSLVQGPYVIQTITVDEPHTLHTGFFNRGSALPIDLAEWASSHAADQLKAAVAAAKQAGGNIPYDVSNNFDNNSPRFLSPLRPYTVIDLGQLFLVVNLGNEGQFNSCQTRRNSSWMEYIKVKQVEAANAVVLFNLKSQHRLRSMK
ncbi:hypothetical protein C0991_001593 [Blastosporella zonata]|nr:hypothetical protein C0991_001593 [Blastosporella zonata]